LIYRAKKCNIKYIKAKKEEYKMKKFTILTISLTLTFMMIFSFFIMHPDKTTAKEHQADGNPEIKSEMKLMQSIYLVNSLNLSSDQINALIPVIKEAQIIHNEIESGKVELENQILAKMKEINKNLANNVNPTEEELTGLMETRKEMQSIMEPYKEKAEELVGKIDTILTEEQKNQIKDYDPKKILKEILKSGEDMEGHGPGRPEDINEEGPGGPDRHDGAKEGKNFERIEKMLQASREGTDEEYNRKKDQLLSFIAAKLGKEKLSWSEIQKKVDEVSKILDKARGLSDEEFEAQKSDLIDQTISLMKRGGEKKYTMAVIRFILNPDLIPVLEGRI